MSSTEEPLRMIEYSIGPPVMIMSRIVRGTLGRFTNLIAQSITCNACIRIVVMEPLSPMCATRCVCLRREACHAGFDPIGLRARFTSNLNFMYKDDWLYVTV